MGASRGPLTRRVLAALLALVLALAHFLQHGETGLLRIAGGERFCELGGVESGEHLAHGLLAERALIERFAADRTVQGEAAFADLAVAFDQLVLVDRHGSGRVIPHLLAR